MDAFDSFWPIWRWNEKKWVPAEPHITVTQDNVWCFTIQSAKSKSLLHVEFMEGVLLFLFMFPAPEDFAILWLSSLWYLMKFIPETCRVHNNRYFISVDYLNS
jgi:hypothetical protein